MNQSFPLNRSRDVASTWPTHPRWLCPETTTLPPTNIAIFINWTQTKWLPNQLTWINFCYFFSLSFSFFFFSYILFSLHKIISKQMKLLGGKKKIPGMLQSWFRKWRWRTKILRSISGCGWASRWCGSPEWPRPSCLTARRKWSPSTGSASPETSKSC